jgi:pimeloyl-ACP methyl ester carboxylesterase
VRAARLLLLTLCILCIGSARTAAAQQVSANFLIEGPRQRTDISDWHADSGRIALSNNLAGATLRGYLYKGKDPAAPTLFFFPGEGMLLDGNDLFYLSLAALGPTVVVYDYRGLGFSSGKPDVALSRKDALTLYDEIGTNLRPGHKVVVYGFSLGSAIAAYTATQRPVAGLVLAAPIASAVDELHVFGKLLGGPLAKATPNPEAVAILDEPALVAQTQAPLLVIHSRKDVIVPFAQGQRVFSASTAPSKQFVELRSALHGETVSRPEAVNAVKQMLTAVR